MFHNKTLSLIGSNPKVDQGWTEVEGSIFAANQMRKFSMIGIIHPAG
jgi:hypothetical protein